MTLELFLGSLLVLTVAAVIIVAMTTQKRVEYPDDDHDRLTHETGKRPRSD